MRALPSLRFLGTLALCAIASCAVACTDDDDDDNTPPADDPADRAPRTVDEDPSLAAVDLSSTRLHVRTEGKADGPVIIVLHGGPGDDYRYMLPLAGRAPDGTSLADDHLLVFFDQRGTGLSRRHDAGELTVADYERDLLDLANHYSPDAPVALLGHSWGGTYAAMFMNRHPERVRAAALLEPGGLSSALRIDDGIEEQRQLLDQITGPILGDGTGLTAADHARADQTLIDTLLELFPGGDIPYARMGSLVLRELEFGELQRPFDFTTDLDQISFEVLFVVGGDSDTAERDRQEAQRALFPRSRLDVVAGADHNGLTRGRADAVIPLVAAALR